MAAHIEPRPMALTRKDGTCHIAIMPDSRPKALPHKANQGVAREAAGQADRRADLAGRRKGSRAAHPGYLAEIASHCGCGRGPNGEPTLGMDCRAPISPPETFGVNRGFRGGLTMTVQPRGRTCNGAGPAEFLSGGIRAEATGDDCGVAAGGNAGEARNPASEPLKRRARRHVIRTPRRHEPLPWNVPLTSFEAYRRDRRNSDCASWSSRRFAGLRPSSPK